jgi:hypothetical protein
MTVTIQRAGMPMAAVQVWGKGFRVTQDSEEFQRYVPTETPTSVLESGLGSAPWGKILEPLYGLSIRELALQRCVLFNADSLIALAFAPTEDRHGRPSLVLTTAATPIAWDRRELPDVAGRTVSLAARLAASYSEVLRRNPPSVERQLRSGSFLSSRQFALSDEAPDASIDWGHVMEAVKLWRGIAGVCTPRLTALGANIVLGTKHEAETARRLREDVDGYFDVRDSEIHPLSARIDRWQPPDVTAAVAAPQPLSYHSPDLAPIAESLQRIERTLDRIADIGGRFVDAGLRLVEHLTRDKRKR